jgi:hypothetical protein
MSIYELQGVVLMDIGLTILVFGLIFSQNNEVSSPLKIAIVFNALIFSTLEITTGISMALHISSLKPISILSTILTFFSKMSLPCFLFGFMITAVPVIVGPHKSTAFYRILWMSTILAGIAIMIYSVVPHNLFAE